MYADCCSVWETASPSSSNQQTFGGHVIQDKLKEALLFAGLIWVSTILFDWSASVIEYCNIYSFFPSFLILLFCYGSSSVPCFLWCSSLWHHCPPRSRSSQLTQTSLNQRSCWSEWKLRIPAKLDPVLSRGFHWSYHVFREYVKRGPCRVLCHTKFLPF